MTEQQMLALQRVRRLWRRSKPLTQYEDARICNLSRRNRVFACILPTRSFEGHVPPPPSFRPCSWNWRSFSTVESCDKANTIDAEATEHTRTKSSTVALKMRVPYQLKLAAASLVEIWEHMEGWGIDDIAIGLAVLWRLRIRQQKHESHATSKINVGTVSEANHEQPSKAPRFWKMQRETDLEFVELARRMLVISHATYDDSEQRVLKYLKERMKHNAGVGDHFEFVKSNFSSRADESRPAYVLGVCHETKNIVLSVRGTWSIDDVLLNVMAAPRQFNGGLAHRGMLLASEAMINEVTQSLRQTKEHFPQYGLITTGHSMGAGIAALAAITLRREYPSVRSFGFSPPACVSLDIAIRSEPFIFSFVHGDDVTPRFHIAAMEQLREELYQIDWRTELLSLAKESWDDVSHYVAQSAFIQSAFQRGVAVNSAISKWLDHLNYRAKLLQHLELIEQHLKVLARVTETKKEHSTGSVSSKNCNVDMNEKVKNQVKYVNKILDVSKRLLLRFNVSLSGEILQLQDGKITPSPEPHVNVPRENETLTRLSHIKTKFQEEISGLWSTLMVKTRHWGSKAETRATEHNGSNEIPARMEAVRESVELVEEALDSIDDTLEAERRHAGYSTETDKRKTLAGRSKELTASLLQRLQPLRSMVYRVPTSPSVSHCSQNHGKVKPERAPNTLMQYYCVGSLYHLIYRELEGDSISVELLKILPIPETSSQTNTLGSGKDFMPPTHHRYLGKVLLSETMISDHFAGEFENHFELLIRDLGKTETGTSKDLAGMT
eukprot:gb/GECG01002900.1/.p1 GENE.gb/GECG01002900.1/~~gb/GECG01002900.1/.p1  ORF type:complete len:780 (+),score=71.88 gb/GECG01002900.1/:1-2340(+)